MNTNTGLDVLSPLAQLGLLHNLSDSIRRCITKPQDHATQTVHPHNRVQARTIAPLLSTLSSQPVSFHPNPDPQVSRMTLLQQCIPYPCSPQADHRQGYLSYANSGIFCTS